MVEEPQLAAKKTTVTVDRKRQREIFLESHKNYSKWPLLLRMSAELVFSRLYKRWSNQLYYRHSQTP